MLNVSGFGLNKASRQDIRRFLVSLVLWFGYLSWPWFFLDPRSLSILAFFFSFCIALITEYIRHTHHAYIMSVSHLSVGRFRHCSSCSDIVLV